MQRVVLWGWLCRPFRRPRFHNFGHGSVLHRPVWISGADRIAVGRGCLLLRSRLTASRATPDGAEPALRIGDRVVMRPFASITAVESVTIEDDVSIASLSTVTDATHDVDTISGPLEPPAAPVRIGRGTGIAQRVAVLAGSNVGRHCYIEANSVVSGEIPDCSIASGAPARVVGKTRER